MCGVRHYASEKHQWPGPDKEEVEREGKAKPVVGFDRVAYQREYMRKWRAKSKGS